MIIYPSYVYKCYLHFELFQIVEENATHCNIHYVGWSKKWDRWVEKKDVIDVEFVDDASIYDDISIDDQKRIFLRELKCLVKLNLKQTQACSSEVQIRQDCTRKLFKEVFGREPSSRPIPLSNSEISVVFEENCLYRIHNRNFDFCYCVDGTLSVQLVAYKPVREYMYSEGSLTEKITKRGHYGLLKFIRREATSQERLDEVIATINV